MSGFGHTWNWIPPSSCNMSWKCSFRNSLPLSLRTHIEGRRLIVSWNMDRNPDVTEGRPLTLLGSFVEISRIHLLQKEYIFNYRCILRRPLHPADRIPTCPSRYLLYGIRANSFLNGLWNIYANCFSNHILMMSTEIFCFGVAAAAADWSFCRVEKADRLRVII